MSTRKSRSFRVRDGTYGDEPSAPSSDSSSASLSDLSSIDDSHSRDEEDASPKTDHSVATPGEPQEELPKKRERRQYFIQPRRCKNCHFSFEKSAQYSGHLKQCKPDRPWNGISTRDRRKRSAAEAVGVRDARVHKPNVTKPRGLPIVPSSSDESDSTPASLLEDSEHDMQAFARRHINMLRMCTTRERLEQMDGHFQRRMAILQHMRAMIQGAIRKFQVTEATVIQTLESHSSDTTPATETDDHHGPLDQPSLILVDALL